MYLYQHLFGSSKVCAVHRHPYVSAPLYTYERDTLLASDLPGESISPVSFITPFAGLSTSITPNLITSNLTTSNLITPNLTVDSLTKGNNSNLFPVKVTSVDYKNQGDRVIFAWTPDPPSGLSSSLPIDQSINSLTGDDFLGRRMYQQFLPSFLAKKGLSNWFFTTQEEQAYQFKRITNNNSSNSSNLSNSPVNSTGSFGKSVDKDLSKRHHKEQIAHHFSYNGELFVL